MPLFIDRLPFACWTDATRSPPLSYWTVVLPVMVTEPSLMIPPAVACVQEWALDTGNRGEAFAWRYHVLQAGQGHSATLTTDLLVVRLNMWRDRRV